MANNTLTYSLPDTVHSFSILTRKRVAYRRSEQQQEYNSPLTYKYNAIIIHNQIQCTHSVSSSQVSLYGPPLNQLCRDDLPRTSNIPLYQSPGPLLGRPLTQPCQDDLSSTMKCPASATQLSTISPPKDLRCPQRVQSTRQSFLGRLQHCLQVPMSSHELGNLSIKSNIL